MDLGTSFHISTLNISPLLFLSFFFFLQQYNVPWPPLFMNIYDVGTPPSFAITNRAAVKVLAVVPLSIGAWFCWLESGEIVEATFSDLQKQQVHMAKPDLCGVN